MHDLNTIVRLNAERFAGLIEKYRRQGRHVLAMYCGGTLMSVETFEREDEAQAALERTRRTTIGGDHAKLFFPAPPADTDSPTQPPSAAN